METIAGAISSWQLVVDSYEEICADLGEEQDALKQTLLYQIASIEARELDSPDRAEEFFQRILANDGGRVDVLDELEELHKSTENWEALVKVLIDKALQNEETHGRAELYQRAALVSEVQLGDKGAAINLYRDILSDCLLYTSPSPRDKRQSRMPSSA